MKVTVKSCDTPTQKFMHIALTSAPVEVFVSPSGAPAQRAIAPHIMVPAKYTTFSCSFTLSVGKKLTETGYKYVQHQADDGRE